MTDAPMPTTIRHLAPPPQRRRRRCGFTLIEIVVVLTLIALLLTIAVPRYFATLDRGRLQVQQQNVAIVRDAIDKFYGDLGRYPETLEELVTKRYLRQVPVDPVSEKPNWVVIAPADASMGAVFDLKPASASGAADAERK